MKVKISLLLILILVLVFPQLGQATEKSVLLYVGTYPVRKFLDVYPGTGSFPLTVFNYTEGKKVKVQMYAADMEQKPDGSVEFLKPGSSKWSFAKYIKFSEREFYLEPGRERRVVCSFRIPEKSKGGMYAAIFAAAIPTTQTKFTPAISYGTIILLKIPHTLDFDGRITEISLSRVEKKHKIKVVFQNTGNVYLWARGEITIKNESGSVIAKNPLSTSGSGVVLREAKRDFYAEIKELKPGTYTAKVKVDFGQRRYIIAEKTFKIGKVAEEGKVLTTRPVQFYVEPTVLESERPLGAYHVLHYKIFNLEDKPIQVKAFVEGIKEIDKKWSCAKWISFSPEKFKIAPQGKKIVAASLRIPSEKLEGGRYARIVFEAHLANEEKDISRAESLALVTISQSEIEKNGKITGIDVGKKGQAVQFKVSFKNTGNVHLNIRGQIRVGDQEKILEQSIFTENALILPGEEKNFIVPISLTEKGKLLAEISFWDVRNGEKKITELKKFEIK